MNTLELTITKEDLEKAKTKRLKGSYYSVFDCIVAQAIKRHFNDKHLTFGYSTLTQDGKMWCAQADLRYFIHLFDDIQYDKIEAQLPKTFTLVLSELTPASACW